MIDHAGVPPRTPIRIEEVDPEDFDDAVPGLAALLVDAVRGGASVNFLADVTDEQAADWWRKRADGIDDGSITLFIAMGGDGRIVGSTLLIRSTNPNSPHRAEIAKVLVHRGARRQGVGTALMTAAEARARADGRWLLILDTVTDSPAAAFYEALGWIRVGVIPEYALDTAGVPEAATYYYKDLR
jgi:GNAT superfamily N-acetyltransferase